MVEGGAPVQVFQGVEIGDRDGDHADGTGLGLPIVNGLIDLHGGTFTLRSKLRQGTEVIVTFPSSRVMTPLTPTDDGPTLQPSLGDGPGSDSEIEPLRSAAQ